MSLDPMFLNAVAAGAAATSSVAATAAFVRARKRAMVDAAEVAASTGNEPATPRGPLRLLVGPIATALRPTSVADLEKLTTRLQNAGRRGRDEAQRFLEEKVIFLLGGLGVGALGGLAIGGLPGLLIMLIGVTVGILGAEKLLDSRVNERQAQVTRGLPSAVDLLVTCLDAGLALDGAVSRVAHDLAHSEPIVAEELKMTAGEFEAGVSLPDALRRLARRVGTDDLAAMCGVVAQASSLGAPIAQTLRDYAVSSRKQRISMLEERAGKLSTRLTLPLALCLLPAALLIILGPAVVQLLKAFH